MKRNFLVVAADAGIRETLAGELRAKGYSVSRAASGAEAEKAIRSVAVDAVLIESHVPDMPPERLKSRLLELRPECRVVVLADFAQVRRTPEQLGFGAGDYLVRGSQALELVRAPFEAAREDAVDAFARRGHEALIQVVDVLVGLLELEDRFFGGFSHQAMRLTRAIAEEICAEEEAITEIVIATLLRDTGKVDLEPELLQEQGWYTDEQREQMKAHVEGSLKLFEHIDFPWKVLPVIRHHHERYDGTGYPDGLRGREIPLGARVVAVVDAFVAMTSGRHHRGAFETEQALTMLTVEAGRQFDPEVVEALQKVLDKRRVTTAGDDKPKVTMVNVQEEFRKVIKMKLVNQGLEVLESDAMSVDRLNEEPTDIIVADLDTGRDAAFALLREIREDATLCGLPVVFLTSRAERILRLQALREGVDDLLRKTEDLEELVARVQNILARESSRREGRAARARRGITGDLENLGLADIVQTLAMGMKTARVTLKCDGRRGRIWFENGAARHANLADREGEEAFYEMVRWTSGRFVIEHGILSKHQSLDHDAMFLVMEGLRRMDESGEDAAKSRTA